MFKLALSAGHYMYTAGKRCSKSLDPNETREWWLNDRIADRIEVLLKQYDGIQVLRLDDTTGQKLVELGPRATASNNFGADFYLAIHHNAGIGGGTGGGIQAYAYSGSVSSKTLDYQKALYNELIKLTGLKGNRSNGCPRADLYECRVPNAPAILLELGFMDSKTDVPIILTQDFAYKCAQACVNVIVAKAGLKKKATTPAATTAPVATYKVVTTINRYSSVADAQAKKNSKGTYAPGTYYIYNKYPKGSSGMFNISTDKTGASAGSWINPAENQAVTETTVEKLYRVRKSKDDAKTQKGAYSNLENAKTACQAAGPEYKVFDWNWVVVYTYAAVVVEPAKKEEAPAAADKKVYELTFPVTHKIVDPDVIQMEGIDEEDCTKAIIAIKKNNPNFNVEIAKAFFTLADEYHINPMRAIAQSVLETGWFKYEGSSVSASQNNFCGLGTTGGGVAGASFADITTGVRAQLQHLYAYGCKDALPDGETTIVDPRFNLVTRGIAPNWEQLAGRWAVPGFDGSDPAAAIKNDTTYGQKIDKIFDTIAKTTVTVDDIKKYFAKEEPKVEEVKKEEPKVEAPVVDNKHKDNVTFVFDILAKLFTNLIEFFKNLGGKE